MGVGGTVRCHLCHAFGKIGEAPCSQQGMGKTAGDNPGLPLPGAVGDLRGFLSESCFS